MHAAPADLEQPCQIRFKSLSDPVGTFAFPCNAAGEVDLDGLSERDRHNYLFARAMVGRTVLRPVVVPQGSD